LLFFILGGGALAVWMQSAAQRESHAIFASLARTNADFIRGAHIPATEQMMHYLSRLLNLQAFLVHGSGSIVPEPEDDLRSLRPALAALAPNSNPRSLNDRYEAIAASITPELRLVLLRPREPALDFLRSRETLAVLASFSLLTVALAGLITRRVVRPLRLLSERLPQIEHDPEATLPGAERSDEIGQLARSYLAARDQLAHEREQRRRAERLSLLGKLATSLAHEIHNPLSAIRLHAQLLLSATAEETARAVAESAPILVDESGRIEGIVNQWMFLARPEPPRARPVDLSRLIHQVAQAYAATARHSRVEIEVQAPSDLTIQGDERRLRQAAANLALNAIQAMALGGALTIRASREAGQIRVTFADSGPGFSPEALARGRELFFSQKEGGMGVGLTVTAEIIEAHGGRLEITNAPEGGGIATLILPEKTE
jgi:signal transduction histidine kinase